MSKPRQLSPTALLVGSMALPPWDRDAGPMTDLARRKGQHVALTRGAAAAVLGTTFAPLPAFVAIGIVRDARIVERPHVEGKVTHACTTAVVWSRFYLEFGENLVGLTFGDAGLWTVDTGERDYEGRTCIRVRPRAEGSSDDLTIATDRRTYRIRLVSNPTKVTLALGWTYPVDPSRSRPTRRLAAFGQTKKASVASVRQTRFMLFELGPDLRQQFRRWAEGLRPTRAWQIQQYRKLYTKAMMPSDSGHPPAVVEFVLSRLLAIDGLCEAEIRQYLELPRDGEQAFVDMLREMATGRRVSRLPLPAGVSPTMTELLDPFPFLAGLPETCYDDADLHQKPPERARRIVWSTTGIADHAALFCAVAPRFIRRPDEISRTLTHLASLERMAAAAGNALRLDCTASLLAALEHLLDSGETAHLGTVVRHDMARHVLLAVSILRKYVRLHDPDGDRGLTRLSPPDPTLLGNLPARLGAMRKEIGEECRSNRKRSVHAQTGRLAALEFAADLNLEQVVLASRALSAAESELGEEDWIDVVIPMTIVDGRGRLVPGRQQCIWRVWSARVYLKRLLRGDWPRLERLRLQARLDAISDGAVHPPVHEYIRTEGVLGSKPMEPFFVRCWRFGLMSRPGPLPQRLLTKRQSVLRELKLPGYMRCATGLMEGGAEELDLWRLSLGRGRTITFLDPFEHALRFGHLGLSTVSENMARTTAWIQQVQDQSGWEMRRLNRRPVAGFLAHDKLSPHADIPDQKTWFPVGPKHQAEMADLVAMTCRRCGYDDGLLPEILHLAKHRWKCPEPQAWVFFYDGAALRTGDTARFLRFLLPGVGRLTYHDFRHLMANAAHEAGVPGWMIRSCLNHGATDLWMYYAELSASQLARIEGLSVRGLMLRSADRRSSAAA